ncbi:hypothetical protein YC2023_014133 [Brassica napus]
MMVTCSKKKKLKKCRKSNSDEIPQHLVMEIIRRLPAKSVARFLLVSKSWANLITNRDFIKSFETRSCSSQPRLLVCFIGRTKPCQRQYCYFFFSSSSSSTTFLSRVKCPREDPECFPCLPHYANGLMRLGYGEKKLICNPSTGADLCLMKFDLRYEKWDLLTRLSSDMSRLGEDCTLINYEGKVAITTTNTSGDTFNVWVIDQAAREPGWAIEKAIDSAILSRRWISLHGDSLVTSLLTRQGFCLVGASVSTVLLSLISKAVQRICCHSRRRISLHGDSLATSLLSRWGFCLDGASVSTVLLSLISNAVQRICCLTDSVLLNTKVKKVCVPPPY